MPKMAFAAGRGVSFSWEEMQAAGLRGDLVDNKVASNTATDLRDPLRHSKGTAAALARCERTRAFSLPAT